MTNKWRMACRMVLPWIAACVIAMPDTAASVDPMTMTVRVDGTLDAGWYQDLQGLRSIGSIQPSNIALSGAEQLGGGNEFVFRLSARFRMQDGEREDPAHKPFWHDEATMGVRGPAGTLRVGRGLDAAYSQDWQFDLWSYLDKVASPAWDIWHYNYPSDPHLNNGEPEYGRLNGGIYYDTPSMNGLGLHLSTTATKRAGDRNRPLGMSLTYQRPGLNALISAEKNCEGDRDRSIALALSGTLVTWSNLFNISTTGSSRAKALTSEIQLTQAGFVYKAGIGVLTVDQHLAEMVTSIGLVRTLSANTNVYWDLALKRVRDGEKRAYGMGINHAF